MSSALVFVFCPCIDFTKLRLTPTFGSMHEYVDTLTTFTRHALVLCWCINFAKLRLTPPFGSMHYGVNFGMPSSGVNLKTSGLTDLLSSRLATWMRVLRPCGSEMIHSFSATCGQSKNMRI